MRNEARPARRCVGHRAVARLLADEIEGASRRGAILVGHSQAGRVLAFVAARARPSIARLVYVSSSLPLAGQMVREMMGDGRHGAHPDRVGWPFDPPNTATVDRMERLFCNDMSPSQAGDFAKRLGADSWPAATYTSTDWSDVVPPGVAATYVRCLGDAILPIERQDVFAMRLGTDRSVSINAEHQAMSTRPNAPAEILRHERSPLTSAIRL